MICDNGFAVNSNNGECAGKLDIMENVIVLYTVLILLDVEDEEEDTDYIIPTYIPCLCCVFVACPGSCNGCFYDAADGRTECAGGQCFNGFVLNVADGRCYGELYISRNVQYCLVITLHVILLREGQ